MKSLLWGVLDLLVLILLFEEVFFFGWKSHKYREGRLLLGLDTFEYARQCYQS